ncbi:MAG: hypothetical protein QM715_14315 [Nibricoccus sp.]
MSDHPPILAKDTNASVAKAEPCGVLLELVSEKFYRDNPFRQLGLAVLASAREVTKRVDELKLAAEFGIAQPDWSFGPEQALTAEQIRLAATALKEPTERLVWELFWFWPENFPEDEGEDPALAHLARGETDHAIEIWQGAAMHGQLAALHNLAVYYHVQALEMEQQESPPEDQLVNLWFKSLRFWEKIGDDEGLWARMRSRVKRMADARVTDTFVAQMRTTLAGALAKICASLALTHAQKGLVNRASLHAALVTHIHGDNAGARHALEEYCSPIARRIDARTNEAKNRLATAASSAALDEAWALLRQCNEDLRHIELLCGRTADYFVEVSNGLVGTALDAVVTYQRETQDDFRCLPVLVHLLDMEALPELKNRVQETFQTVYGNALMRESRPPMETSDEMVEALATSDDLRAFQLIVDQLVPAVEQLDLGPAARQMYAARVARLLKDLALAAGMERDDIDLALRAFDVALTLPVGDSLGEALASDRAQLQRDFETRKEKELQVEAEGVRLIVNRYGICLNDQWVTPVEVAGLRHGMLAPGEEGGEGTYVIAWRSYAGQEFELNASNLLLPSSYVEEHYMRILDSIYHFIVPGLVNRLSNDIREGREVVLGATPLRLEGMYLAGGGSRFWKKDEPVSYTKLQTEIEGGLLIVSSKENPRQSESHDVALVWNAVIFSYVLEALTRE